MASHKTVHVASATVIGLLIGIVSVLSFGAQGTTISYVNQVEDVGIFKKRNIIREYYSFPPIPRYLPVTDGTTYEAAPTFDVSDISLNCLIRGSIILELRDEVMRSIPSDRNILTYNSIMRVFDNAIGDCEELLLYQLEMMDEEEEMIETTTVRKAAADCYDPDYCTMFSRKRYMQCIGAQRSGACYRPSQYDRIR